MTPAQELTAALGGRWNGSGGAAKCPCHDDRSPSLSIRDGTTETIFHCFSGCSSIEIVRELVRRHLLDRRHDAPRPSPRPPDDRSRLEVARRIWGESMRLDRSPGAAYLRGRGIALDAPLSLRWHRGLKHSPTGLILPAMVAGVQASDRALVAVHRTFLTAGSAKKSSVSAPKMGLGRYGAGAVRLAAAGETLGLAEGIETGLSAMQLFGVPVWATLGAERLGKIEMPEIVRRMILFADRGAEAQIEKARRTYEAQGREVEIQYPPAPAKDWNDHLIALSAAA